MFPLLEEVHACPACGSPRLRPLHVYANKRRVIARAPNLAMIGCEECGVLFSHPLPSDAELEAYYESDYWEERLPRAAAGREEKLRRHTEQLTLLRPHLEAADRAEDYAPRVFDYGCGRGEWLDVLAGEGWETHGLEPGDAARSFAGERHSIVGEVPTDESFDLVILNHVLEHLREPLDVLRSVVGAARPGGHVFISTPDLGRLPEHGRFSYVKSGVHIMSYTFPAMSSLFALAGLEVVGHFDGPEWDAVMAPEAGRLKCLGRKVDTPPPLPERPLEAAIGSLRAYAEGEAAEEAAARAKPEARRRSARELIGRLAGR